MASSQRHVVCTECFVGQDRAVDQSFLGFYKFNCVACGARCEYPLSTAYRVIYVLLASALLVSLFGTLVMHENFGGGCGIFSIGGIIALIYDWRARDKVKRAEANERQSPSNMADTFR